MLIVIENDYLAQLYGDVAKGKPKFSKDVIEKFKKKVNLMKNVANLTELRKIGGLNFEALSGDFKGKHSVRVDLKYRLILRIEKDKISVEDIIVVEDLTNHYR
jgi:plasmid maintenance system killer protein